MRRDGGYAVIEGADGKKIEMATQTCKHCNAIVHIKPKCNPDDLGGLCYVCWGFVCPNCVGKGCDEVERKLERMEASYHARRSYGL